MQVKIKTQYIDDMVELRKGRYGNNTIAIRGFALDGEPYFTATVALPELPADGCVFIKDWSENEGIANALVEAGVIRLTGRMVATGFCNALEAELLVNLE